MVVHYGLIITGVNTQKRFERFSLVTTSSGLISYRNLSSFLLAVSS